MSQTPVNEDPSIKTKCYLEVSRCPDDGGGDQDTEDTEEHQDDQHTACCHHLKQDEAKYDGGEGS